MIHEGHKLRHEYKYYINNGTCHILRLRLRDFMQPDGNMHKERGYLVSSLYFDDMYAAAMDEKLAGTRFRKKFRIRVYERDASVIKLECKMKFDSFIAKESALLSVEEYYSILNGEYGFLLKRDENVCRELYMQHNISRLMPVAVVEYLREAYVLRYGNVRLTFDKNIAASFDATDLLGESCPVTEILPEGVLVLEVKYDDYLPEYIRQLLQIGEAEKCAISKYVMCREKNRIIRHY